MDVGDPVFTDEIVRTGVDSATKLVFRDSTNLALGPRSRVVLDRFVYDPSQPSEGLGVTLAKGLFRFTTGSLQKSAYTVTTPTAVIGVRGTVFDGDVTTASHAGHAEGRRRSALPEKERNSHSKSRRANVRRVIPRIAIALI